MARCYDVVHSFEPNPGVTEALLAWSNPRVQVHHVALSNVRGFASLRIPLSKGVPLAGWASLGEGRLPPGHDFLELEVPTVRLDDLELQDVRLMKIDVERHEMAVLEGARQTLARSRPVIILELDDGNRAAIEGFARELGYLVTTLFEHLGVTPSPQNVLLIPR
jgi:FkbM family methyltransferase